MTFVNPSFLWALLAISVPVLIHLFNFRKYKKVYFTNVRFLKALEIESKSKSRLKEILILITRSLLIACLVMAFSQPFIPTNKNNNQVNGAKSIGIYIDNSFSMANVGKQGPLIELAKNKAKEIVTAFGTEDKFHLVTNDFEGKHQRFYSRDAMIELINGIKPTAARPLLSQAISRQSDFLMQEGTNFKKIYIISDAQKSSFDLARIEADTSIQIVLIPLEANLVNNVYIDSCWFESPIQQLGFIQKLHAKIVNSGKQIIESASAKLYLNNKQIALSSFSISADAEQEIQFTFDCNQSGFNFASIKIEDYPVSFDDELFFAFNSNLNISVYLINGKGQEETNSFESLFISDSLFKFTTSSEQGINYNYFKSRDVIILNQLADLSSGMISEIQKFSQLGGALVIIPPEQLNNSYTDAFQLLGLPSIRDKDTVSQRVEKIELASGFYDGVFVKNDDRMNLPMVSWHYRLNNSSHSDFETILNLQNKEDFFGFSRLNNSTIYLFTSSIDKTSGNFSKHALFVPSFYRLALKSLKPLPLFYPVGNNLMIPLKNEISFDSKPPHIKQLAGDLDLIPENRKLNNSLNLYTQNQIQQAGFYEVIWNEKQLLPLAFNFSRLESELSCYTQSELESLIQNNFPQQVQMIKDVNDRFNDQILHGAEGKRLWKLFIILAFVCVIIELSLLKILK